MHKSDITPEDIAIRGEEIYKQNIRAKVETEHKGKFLAVDIDTCDYAIADEDLEATDLLLLKQPNATVYGLRIGFPAAYRIGCIVSVLNQ